MLAAEQPFRLLLLATCEYSPGLSSQERQLALVLWKWSLLWLLLVFEKRTLILVLMLTMKMLKEFAVKEEGRKINVNV